MRLLLVGRYDSVLNQEFCERLMNFGHEVDLFDITNYTFYNLNTKRMISYNRNSKELNKFLPLLYLDRIFQSKKYLIKINQDYDILIYLYIKYEYLFLYKSLNSKAKKIIATVWGSDFWKNPIKFMFKKFYLKADLITVNNEKLREELIKYFSKSIDDKTIVCRFGVGSLDFIDQIKINETINQCKRKLGLNENSITITIGSRADSLEQHKKIINELKLLIDYKNIQLVFPLTYGNVTYKDIIIKYIKMTLNNEKIVIFDKFLTNEDIARLRLSTNIFINLRETDQFSSAMLQHFYAGSLVINGSWLPYQELYKRGIFCFLLNNIHELPETIKEIINKMEYYKHNLLGKRK